MYGERGSILVLIRGIKTFFKKRGGGIKFVKEEEGCDWIL